jgi:hypothetical protein
MSSILESLQSCDPSVKVLAGVGSLILAKALIQVRLLPSYLLEKMKMIAVPNSATQGS